MLKPQTFWILKYAARRARCELKSPRDYALIEGLKDARAQDPDAPDVGATLVRHRNRAARVIGKHVKKDLTI